jgi:hypothetical protein
MPTAEIGLPNRSLFIDIRAKNLTRIADWFTPYRACNVQAKKQK